MSKRTYLKTSLVVLLVFLASLWVPKDTSWGVQAYQTVPTVGPSPTPTSTGTPVATQTVAASPTHRSSATPGGGAATAAASSTPTPFLSVTSQPATLEAGTVTAPAVSETLVAEPSSPTNTITAYPEVTELPGTTALPVRTQPTASMTPQAAGGTSSPAGQVTTRSNSSIFFLILVLLVLLVGVGWILLRKRPEA